jgi:capsule polysaccharide export protein KpsE/RkpR
MGNITGKGYKKHNNLYSISNEILDTDKYELENTIHDLKLKVHNNTILISSLEHQLLKIQTQLNKTLEHANMIETNLNMKINIINADMESLLNNDKLLLGKMIEKRMLSTIDDVNEIQEFGKLGELGELGLPLEREEKYKGIDEEDEFEDIA